MFEGQNSYVNKFSYNLFFIKCIRPMSRTCRSSQEMWVS